jgi:hypothetical protein
MPSAVARWLNATGLYRGVVDDTPAVPVNLGGIRYNIEHAKTLNPSDISDVFMFINTKMIQATLPETLLEKLAEIVTDQIPTHYVSLLSTVTEAADGKVSFKYWCWGNKPSNCTIDVDEFNQYYYGAIIADIKQA